MRWLSVDVDMASRSEAAIRTDEVGDFGVGSKWSDLLNWRVGCFACDGDEAQRVQRLPKVGFLCVTFAGSVACPARKTASERMQFPCVLSDGGVALKESLRELYSYPAAQGYGERVPEGVAVRRAEE